MEVKMGKLTGKPKKKTVGRTAGKEERSIAHRMEVMRLLTGLKTVVAKLTEADVMLPESMEPVQMEIPMRTGTLMVTWTPTETPMLMVMAIPTVAGPAMETAIVISTAIPTETRISHAAMKSSRTGVTATKPGATSGRRRSPRGSTSNGRKRGSAAKP
jgi:hypothetical protein